MFFRRKPPPQPRHPAAAASPVAAPSRAVPPAAATRPPTPGGRSLDIPGVEHFVAIASGKGGVGKSTVSANVATSLARAGARVGLLDADIYGPTIPALFGRHDRPPVLGQKIVPLEAYGVKMMSLGVLVASDQATIWRGPMVAQAVQQLLRDVAWGELEYLLIDLPPGTGDAPLTLAQSLNLAGVAIVSTPQDVALTIATRSLQMFKSLHVPILGVVENMSSFICPSCGQRHEIFGHGGVKEACERLRVPFLGEIPLHQAIRESGDAGMPVVIAQPDSPEAHAFGVVAQNLRRRVTIQSRRSLPVIQVASG